MRRAGRGGFTEALDGSGQDLYDQVHRAVLPILRHHTKRLTLDSATFVNRNQARAAAGAATGAGDLLWRMGYLHHDAECVVLRVAEGGRPEGGVAQELAHRQVDHTCAQTRGRSASFGS